jgi:hypothetical protein
MKQIRFIVSACIALLVFTGCSDDDQISYALQNISAPTNVEAVFDIAQDDTGTVSVTPTAIGANSFNVFYGDAEGETPTQVSPGETVSHVYGEGTYELRIVAVGATGLTSELVRIVTISFTPPSNLNVDIPFRKPTPLRYSYRPRLRTPRCSIFITGMPKTRIPRPSWPGKPPPISMLKRVTLPFAS